jgi:hypothetical protein
LWAGGVAAFAVVSFAAGSGCGSNPVYDIDAGTDEGSGAGPDASTDGQLLGDTEKPFTCDSSTVRCSSDLQHFVDCAGRIVSSCPTGQGCTESGECVPACDAAKASGGAIGCDYYAVPPYTLGRNGCYATFVVNTWGSNVKIDVERDGTTYDVSKFAYTPVGTGRLLEYQPLVGGELPPGQVAIVFLAGSSSSGYGCPRDITTATQSPTYVSGTGVGKAFHITTSVPVVTYDIFPYGGGASAIASSSLLLPTPSWGDNYIGITASNGHAGANYYDSWMTIVASDDATSVTLSPTVDIVGGGGIEPLAQGTPHTYTLQKGDVLQFSQLAELVGTPIQSNKPIAVIGGAECAFLPSETGYCDSLHQQIPPIKAFGSEYVAVRHRDRYDFKNESPPWRIVGAVDGTTLTYVPSAPAGAPTSLASGQMVEFNADAPFIVKSQDANHPFYVGEYMSSCRNYGSDKDCRGDPEFVNVLTPQQYMTGYTFFTDPTYSETHLVVVRAKKQGKLEDVSLDCAGTLGGWQALGDYQWTRVDLVRHDFEPQGDCDNGRHEIKSEGPFGVTVWGWGSAETGPQNSVNYTQCVSYGYPAGGGARALNTVVVPPTPN